MGFVPAGSTLPASTAAEGSTPERCLLPAFAALQLQAHGAYGLRKDYPMDLGQFLQLLTQHQRGHVFEALFGVRDKQGAG